MTAAVRYSAMNTP